MTRTLVEVVCPLCGSDRSRMLFEVRDWAFRITEDWFGLRRCGACGCGFVSPRPPPEEIFRYYPQSYYWSHEGKGRALNRHETLALRRPQLETKARILADMKPGRLLDIGAQKGEFLWFMRERQWQVEGVEIDNSVPNPHSMPIRYGDFLSMSFEDNSYDVVTAWAVLEHVYEPSRFIERAAALLRPGGRLIAVVTNLNSLQSRFFRADDYPRHLTIFTKRSVRLFARKYGLRPLRMWTDQRLFGGSLTGYLVYLLKRLGGYRPDEAFAEWRQIEDPLLFYLCWRGRRSKFVLNVSRLDRLLTFVPERLLDALGFGFNLTFVLEKPK